MKVYSMWKPSPEPTGQVFIQPSLTDVLADEPLERIYRRFVLSGQAPRLVDGDVDVDASESELDSALADSALDDISQMTRVEQQDILETAKRLVEQLKSSAVSRTEERNMEASATGAQAESNEKVNEQKGQ